MVTSGEWRQIKCVRVLTFFNTNAIWGLYARTVYAGWYGRYNWSSKINLLDQIAKIIEYMQISHCAIRLTVKRSLTVKTIAVYFKCNPVIVVA